MPFILDFLERFSRFLPWGLASKTPLGGNKASELRLFWVDFGFKLVDSKSIQSIKHKFSSSFLYLFYALFLFFLFDVVKLDYV